MKKAEQLTACDISPGMIKYAKIQKKKYKNKKIKILKADAEKLNFPNNFFDYTFCFALTKHLPTKIQFKVLNELSRVSKKGFICTLPVGNFFSRIIYNFRGKKLKAELKLIKKSKLNRFINDNNLTVVFKKKLTSFLGVEYIFYFKKI